MASKVCESCVSKEVLWQVESLIVENYESYQSLASSKEKEWMPSLQVGTDGFLQLMQWVPVLLSPAQLAQIQGLQQKIKSQSEFYIHTLR